MKRFISTSIAMLMLFILVSAAQAEFISARVLIGSREAVVSPRPVFDGTRVLAPISILESIGATFGAEIDGKVHVTNALGRASDIETVHINGYLMLPMNKVADAVGLGYTWDDAKKTLTLMARLETVEFVDNVLKINCTIPVSYKVSSWGANGKLIIDVNSAKVATVANEVYIGSSLIARARVGQTDETTARVVLDLEKGVSYTINSTPLAAQILISVSEKATEQTPAAKPPAIRAKPFTISEIRIEQVDDYQFRVIMATSNKGAISTSFSAKPARITLNMPNCTLADSAAALIGSHPLLSEMKTSQDQAAHSAKLELILNRAMICDTSIQESSITLLVRPPDKSGGLLADKLIVIDPGHGGNQPGAKGKNVLEKNLNLALAQEMSTALQALGANVVLTRSIDEAVGLPARPGVAIAASADMFISIHCNSNGTPNSATGIETYYHKYEPSSKMMADYIHDSVCAATGMCSRKSRSDRSLYDTGLAVLRGLEGSGIPGLLLECGYLNNSADCSKLIDPAYRKKVAQGVVAGLNMYVEGK